jgi:type II secretory pathway pseudopilin PulG
MIVPHKKAFSMLTAIVVIVTMAVIASYVTSIADKTLKITTDQYRKEQAMFYAKSYTEYAIMAVSARDRVNQDCIDNIDAVIAQNQEGLLANRGRGVGYRVRIRISYIGDPSVGTCAIARQLSTAVNNPNTPLSIIVDAYVDYNDLNDNRPDDGELRHFTYHRRSLQKI